MNIFGSRPHLFISKIFSNRRVVIFPIPIYGFAEEKNKRTIENTTIIVDSIV